MMNDDDLDLNVAQLLKGWQAPPPSENAVARILAAAQATPSRSIAGTPHRYRRMMYIGPLAAAAMAIGVVSYNHNRAVPQNDMVLQQSALSAFSISGPSADTEDMSQ